MGQFIYDALNSFGNASLSGAGTEFPDIINLGEAKADRMTVDILCDTAAGGTSLAVTVQGSATGSSGWADVGKNTVSLADLKAGKGSVAISPNPYQYLKVVFTKTGTFTAGTVQARLNSYVGK
jgi:hypothetical protein